MFDSWNYGTSSQSTFSSDKSNFKTFNFFGPFEAGSFLMFRIFLGCSNFVAIIILRHKKFKKKCQQIFRLECFQIPSVCDVRFVFKNKIMKKSSFCTKLGEQPKFDKSGCFESRIACRRYYQDLAALLQSSSRKSVINAWDCRLIKGTSITLSQH